MLTTPSPLASSVSETDKPVAHSHPFPHTGITILTLLLSDVLIIYLGGWGSAILQSQWGNPMPESWFLEWFPYVFLFILALTAANLYPAPGITPPEELRRIVLSISVMSMSLMATNLFFRHGDILLSLSAGLFVWGSAILLIPLGRAVVRASLAQYPWWGTALVVRGDGDSVAKAVQCLQERPGLGFKVVGVMRDERGACLNLPQVPVIGSQEEARAFVEKGVHFLLLARDGRTPERMMPVLRAQGTLFPQVIMLADSVGNTTFWVEALDMGGVLGLQLRHKLLLPSRQMMKRTMDLTLTLVGGVLILPLLLVVAAAIRMDSPGPILYRHTRVGRDGKPFQVCKFRSMYQDAEHRLREILDRDPALRAEFQQYHKLSQDPRVTRVGRFLRKSSLDELPQLWNVLKGEMSLVGPRPVTPAEIEEMGSARELILRVIPGITGFWQVSGRSNVSYAERIQMELYYVRSWSLWFDLYLLARTVSSVLMGRGAR